VRVAGRVDWIWSNRFELVVAASPAVNPWGEVGRNENSVMWKRADTGFVCFGHLRHEIPTAKSRGYPPGVARLGVRGYVQHEGKRCCDYVPHTPSRGMRVTWWGAAAIVTEVIGDACRLHFCDEPVPREDWYPWQCEAFTPVPVDLKPTRAGAAVVTSTDAEIAALTDALPKNEAARLRNVAALKAEMGRPFVPRFPHEGRSDRALPRSNGKL